MGKKKIWTVLIVICACFSLCGMGWFGSVKVVMDTESNKIYRYCTADTVLSDFAKDSKGAKARYQNELVLLSGKIKEIGKNGKNITVSGIQISGQGIVCSYNKELRTTASSLHNGDDVAVYGTFTVDVFDQELRIKAVKITEVPSAVTSHEMYYLLDGTSFDKAKAVKVSLKDGAAEYVIPSSWTGKEIQRDIEAEKLGFMEGYQYVLNQLGAGSSVPESLFICYFDNQTQLSDYQNVSGETEQIEKVIVENILGKVGSFPSKRVKTYYGKEYVYYTGSYQTAFDAGTGYHTEFVFQADGEDGIVVMLYVYKEPKHLSDIMFVSRFLEIK